MGEYAEMATEDAMALGGFFDVEPREDDDGDEPMSGAVANKRPRKERMPGPCNMVWESRDGKKIRVRSMKDSQLLNSILYVERHADLLQAARIVQVEQNAMRSYDAADREAAALRKKSPEEFLVNYPPYRKLFNEARRRCLVLIPVTSWCEKAYDSPLPAI